MELILSSQSLREPWTRCQKLNSRCRALRHLFVLLRNSWVLSVQSQAYLPLKWVHSKKKKNYTSERTGVRGCAARNAHRGNMVSLGNKMPLLGTRGAGLPLHPHSSPCLHELENLPPEQAWPCLLQLLPVCATTSTSHTPQMWPPFPSPAWAAPIICCFHSCSPGQGKDVWGCCATEMGPKPKLNP